MFIPYVKKVTDSSAICQILTFDARCCHFKNVTVIDPNWQLILFDRAM